MKIRTCLANIDMMMGGVTFSRATPSLPMNDFATFEERARRVAGSPATVEAELPF